MIGELKNYGIQGDWEVFTLEAPADPYGFTGKYTLRRKEQMVGEVLGDDYPRFVWEGRCGDCPKFHRAQHRHHAATWLEVHHGAHHRGSR